MLRTLSLPARWLREPPPAQYCGMYNALLRRLFPGLKITQAELARRASLTPQEVHRFLRGTTKLSARAARQIAAAVGASPHDLIEDHAARIPLTTFVAGAFAERRPASLDLAAQDRTWLEAPGLARPDECFAARVIDDSAEGLGLPRGSLLFVRRSVKGARRLAEGALILARRQLGPSAEETEILAGELATDEAGALVLLTASRRREVPSVLTIRAAPAPQPGFAEPQSPFRRGGLVYAPSPGDAAEILGVVEYALTPQAPRPRRSKRHRKSDKMI